MILLTGCARSASDYLARGDEQFKKGNRAEAEINYRKAIAKDQKLAKAYLGLGKTALQGNDFVEAYRALTFAVQLMPDDPEALRLQAEVATGAYLIDPKHPVYLKDNLLATADRMEAQDSKTPEGLKIRGLIAATEGDHATALDYFRRASARDPKQLGLKLLEVQAQQQSGDDAGAEAAAKTLIQNNPQFSPGYDWLLRHYVARKRTADIEDLLRRKIEANPDQIEFQLQLAKLRYQSGRKDEADQTIRQVIGRPDPNSPLAVGDFYMSLGETDIAMGFYRQGLTKSPEVKKAARKRMANVMITKRSYKEALSLISSARNEDRTDEEAARMEADVRAQTGDPKDIEIAIKIYREVLGKNPGDTTVRFNLAQTLLAKGDNSGRRELEKCVGTTPNFIPAITRLSQIYRATNEPRELLNLAERILAADPTNIGARILKAEGLLGVGRASEARNLMAMPIEEPAMKTDAALLHARALVAEGQVAQAEKELRELYRPGSTDLRPLNALSDLLLARRSVLKEGDQKAFGAQIVEMWARELAAHPGSQPVIRSYAKAAYFAGLHEKALEVTSKAPQDDVEAQTLRAASLFATSRQKEALDLLKRVSTLPQANTNLIEGLLAYLYSREGNRQAAVLYYKQILQRDPKSAFAMNNLAYVLADLGEELEEAHRLASKAVSTEPDRAEYQDTLGFVLTKLGKNKEAASLLSALVQKQPRNPVFRYHYAVAILNNGQRTQAGKELELALGHSPDPELMQLIRKAQQSTR